MNPSSHLTVLCLIPSHVKIVIIKSAFEVCYRKNEIIGHTESYQVRLSLRKSVVHTQICNCPKIDKSTFFAKPHP